MVVCGLGAPLARSNGTILVIPCSLRPADVSLPIGKAEYGSRRLLTAWQLGECLQADMNYVERGVQPSPRQPRFVFFFARISSR